MTSHLENPTTTDVKPEMIPGVYTEMESHMIDIIYAALPMRATSKDNIFMQKRLEIDKSHIPICTHVPNLHVPKHIGRPMWGLFFVEIIPDFGPNFPFSMQIRIFIISLWEVQQPSKCSQFKNNPKLMWKGGGQHLSKKSETQTFLNFLKWPHNCLFVLLTDSPDLIRNICSPEVALR